MWRFQNVFYFSQYHSSCFSSHWNKFFSISTTNRICDSTMHIHLLLLELSIFYPCKSRKLLLIIAMKQEKWQFRTFEFCGWSWSKINLVPTFRVFIRSIEVSGYIYVHEHYCIVEFSWDSPWTWLFSFFAVDLGYYWAHRMGHGKLIWLQIYFKITFLTTIQLWKFNVKTKKTFP